MLVAPNPSQPCFKKEIAGESKLKFEVGLQYQSLGCPLAVLLNSVGLASKVSESHLQSISNEAMAAFQVLCVLMEAKGKHLGSLSFRPKGRARTRILHQLTEARILD